MRRGRQACLCGNITVGDLVFIFFLLVLGGEKQQQQSTEGPQPDLRLQERGDKIKINI